MQFLIQKSIDKIQKSIIIKVSNTKKYLIERTQTLTNSKGECKMAKLNEKNADYAVVRTAAHGGGTVGFYNSYAYAKRVERDNTISGCCCGCCAIVPVTAVGKEILINHILDNEYAWNDKSARKYYENEIVLYDELPNFNGNNHYSTICK